MNGEVSLLLLLQPLRLCRRVLARVSAAIAHRLGGDTLIDLNAAAKGLLRAGLNILAP